MISNVENVCKHHQRTYIKRKSMLSGLKTRFFKVLAPYCSIRTEHRRNLRFAQNCREDSCASNALVQIKNPTCLLSLARLFCKDLPDTPLGRIRKFLFLHMVTSPGLGYTMMKTRPRQLFSFSSYSIYSIPPSILKWIVVIGRFFRL